MELPSSSWTSLNEMLNVAASLCVCRCVSGDRCAGVRPFPHQLHLITVIFRYAALPDLSLCTIPPVQSPAPHLISSPLLPFLRTPSLPAQEPDPVYQLPAQLFPTIQNKHFVVII